MNRRSFLATGCAAIVSGLAGCGVDTSDPEGPEWTTVTEDVGGSGGSEEIGGSERTWVIENVEGLEGSRVFEKVELDDNANMDIHLTREATLELSVDEIETASFCDNAEYPDSWETEVDTGDRIAFIPLSCTEDTMRVETAALGPAGQVVDSMIVYMEKV